MNLERPIRTLLILLIIIASLYLIQRFWQILSALGDVLLILGIGWLVAYVLSPAVDWLARLHAPGWARKRMVRVFGARVANAIADFRIGHVAAAAIAYLGLLAVIVVTAIYLIPLLVQQLTQLSAHIPDILAGIPKVLASADAWLAARDINISLTNLYNQFVGAQQIQALLAQAVQYAIGLARTLVSAVAASLLILAVSFYTVLEGRRFGAQLYSLVPRQFQDEIDFASKTIDRIFGGFVRGQVLMAAIYTVVTLVITVIAGLPSALVVSWVSGLVMLFPLVGAPVAMLLPGIVALFQQPGAAVWLFIIMIAFQQVELHFLIPRIMSEAMGLPTLLIIAATLLGVILLGFWGLVFGVPVVAVLYALGVYWLERVKKRLDAEAEGSGLP